MIRFLVVALLIATFLLWEMREVFLILFITWAIAFAMCVVFSLIAASKGTEQ